MSLPELPNYRVTRVSQAGSKKRKSFPSFVPLDMCSLFPSDIRHGESICDTCMRHVCSCSFPVFPSIFSRAQYYVLCCMLVLLPFSCFSKFFHAFSSVQYCRRPVKSRNGEECVR